MERTRLVDITGENLTDVIDLPLRPGQDRFVAPVVKSLAEAYVTPTAWPRAIVVGEEVAGFVMANFDPGNEIEEFRCGIWRLNVAARFQGQGVGRFAVNEVAREARARGEERMTVMWVQGDGGPEPFYLRCGFVPTGQMLFEQVVGSRPTTVAG